MTMKHYVIAASMILSSVLWKSSVESAPINADGSINLTLAITQMQEYKKDYLDMERVLMARESGNIAAVAFNCKQWGQFHYKGQTFLCVHMTSKKNKLLVTN